MVEINKDTVSFLLDMADQLELWAIESRRGGWSTHQVEANRQWASKCRQQAALETSLREQTAYPPRLPAVVTAGNPERQQ